MMMMMMKMMMMMMMRKRVIRMANHDVDDDYDDGNGVYDDE